MHNIKYDEFEENQIADIKNLVAIVTHYFDGDVTKLYLDGSDKDELAPRRFIVYFARTLYNATYMQLAAALDTTFKGVYLDYNYIHEMVLKREEKFIKIASSIEDELGLNKEYQSDNDALKDDNVFKNNDSINDITDDVEDDVNQFKLFDDDDTDDKSDLFNDNEDDSLVQNKLNDSFIDYKELIDQAIKARKMAYAPYSDFEVGAALLCADGEIYMGCNIENASYGLSNCAERTAIFKAVSRGHKDFKAIAIVGAVSEVNNSNYDFDVEYSGCMPCGACLQVMSEFCHNDFEIILVKTAADYEIKTLGELMPSRFNLV